MATWPSSLVITRDSFTEKPPSNTIRSQMDVGPAKIRRRTTASVRPISFMLFLTRAQVEILDAFYLDNDVLPFDFTHPRTSASVKARFVNPPEYSATETMFNVAVEIEILP